MKCFYLLLFSCLFLIAESQTRELEVKNISDQFAAGKFDASTYKQFGKNWQDVLQSIGGYPQLPYNDSTKKIEYIKVFYFNGLDKNCIYDRVMEWSAINFGSLSEVLNYSNKENGKIILKGSFSISFKKDIESFFFDKKETIDFVTANGTWSFTIMNGKMKLEVKNLNFWFFVAAQQYGTYYIPSYSYNKILSSFYPITSAKTIEWKGRLDLLKQLSINIDFFMLDVSCYVKTKNMDYTF